MSSLSSISRSLADERGFTLVELLTAMTIGLLIAFSALTAFETFDRGAAANSRITDAEDNGRRNVANMVSLLRDAGAPAPSSATVPQTVVRALPNDVVFKSTSWPGESATGLAGTATHIERLCLDTSTKTVWFDGLRSGTTGPTDPGASCPSTASGWTHSPMARNVANTDALPLFRIGASPVRSIGIQLRTEHGTVTTARSLLLNSGGTMRGALPPEVDTGDITHTCNYDGSGKALLSLTGDADLTLTATGAVSVAANKILVTVTAHATTQVAVTVTNALGLQTLLFKDVTCP